MHNSQFTIKQPRIFHHASCIVHRALFLALCIVHCASCIVSAQTDINLHSHFLKDTTENMMINLSTGFYLASDAITNELSSDYYFNRFITDDVKDGVSKNLHNHNHFGAEVNGDLSFTFRPDSAAKNLQAFIAVRQRDQYNADFTRDVFELFFRGNKDYAGKTADLSDSKFRTITYQQVAFGIGSERKLKNGATLRAAFDVGINFGRSFNNLETGHTTIYTHPEGEYLDADVHLTLQSDDSSSSNVSHLDGSGLSGDFYLEYSTERSNISVSVENLGYIQWNKFSTEIPIDSTFRFDGVDVSYLFNFKDTVHSSTAIDTVLFYNFITHRTEKRIKMLLPMKISAAYSRYYLDKKLLATAGIDILGNTTPVGTRFYLAGKYHFHRLNEAGIVFSYGGFTKLTGGLNYVHLFPKKWKFEIGSNYLFSMIAYKQGLAQGGYFILSKGF